MIARRHRSHSYAREAKGRLDNLALIKHWGWAELLLERDFLCSIIPAVFCAYVISYAL